MDKARQFFELGLEEGWLERQGRATAMKAVAWVESVHWHYLELRDPDWILADAVTVYLAARASGIAVYFNRDRSDFRLGLAYRRRMKRRR